MLPLSEEIKSTFYVKPSEDKLSIEVMDSFELSNEFKQMVCLPYFKDVYKVFYIVTNSIGFKLTVRQACERNQQNLFS